MGSQAAHRPIGDREPLVATPPPISLFILAGQQFVDCPPDKLGHRWIATNDQRGYPRLGHCIEAVGKDTILNHRNPQSFSETSNFGAQVIADPHLLKSSTSISVSNNLAMIAAILR
jgi:hypothetical protein